MPDVGKFEKGNLDNSQKKKFQNLPHGIFLAVNSNQGHYHDTSLNPHPEVAFD